MFDCFEAEIEKSQASFQIDQISSVAVCKNLKTGLKRPREFEPRFRSHALVKTEFCEDKKCK